MDTLAEGHAAAVLDHLGGDAAALRDRAGAIARRALEVQDAAEALLAAPSSATVEARARDAPGHSCAWTRSQLLF